MSQPLSDALRVRDGRRARGRGSCSPAAGRAAGRDPTVKAVRAALRRSWRVRPSRRPTPLPRRRRGGRRVWAFGRPPATCPRSTSKLPWEPRRGSASGAARTIAPRRRRWRARSSTCWRRGEVRPEAVCVIVGSGWREGPDRCCARGAPGPVPLRRRRRLLPAARGPRRLAWLRMLADPVGRGRGRPSATARRSTALGRPGEGDDDRAPAQARHDLGLRGGAREPSAPARGPRPHPGLPQSTGPPPAAWASCAPTSSCAG